MVIDTGTFLTLSASAGENTLQLWKSTLKSLRVYMTTLTSMRSEDSRGKTNGVRKGLALALSVVGVVESEPFSVMRRRFAFGVKLCFFLRRFGVGSTLKDAERTISFFPYAKNFLARKLFQTGCHKA